MGEYLYRGISGSEKEEGMVGWKIDGMGSWWVDWKSTTVPDVM